MFRHIVGHTCAWTSLPEGILYIYFFILHAEYKISTSRLLEAKTTPRMKGREALQDGKRHWSLRPTFAPSEKPHQWLLKFTEAVTDAIAFPSIGKICSSTPCLVETGRKEAGSEQP